MYRNNPAFRIVHLDPDLQAIKEYEQYYMNITRTGKITIVYNFVSFYFVLQCQLPHGDSTSKEQETNKLTNQQQTTCYKATNQLTNKPTNQQTNK